MAKVNHRLVKQRLNEHRSKITDRQFFSSRLLAGHFEDLAAAQTRRYHYNRRVHVSLYWKPKEEHLASTDNLFIRINAGHPMVTKVKGRENRYQVICGLFAHELGHVLHTDFLAEQTRMNCFASCRWYPYPPDLKTAADIRNEKAFWDYVKADPKNLEMAMMVAHHISNVIEDGYIENRMLMDFPGTIGYGLERFRERHFDMIPTVTQMIEQEEDGNSHIFESILQIILSYAKFGEIKYGDEPLGDERIQAVFSLISEIDSALLGGSGKERLNASNVILVRCWEYIEAFCEECRQRKETLEAAGGSADITEIMSEILRSLAGSTSIGEGDSSPVSETPGSAAGSATASARLRTHADASKPEDEGGPDKEDADPQTETEDEDPHTGLEEDGGPHTGLEENEDPHTGIEEDENPSGSGAPDPEEEFELPFGPAAPLMNGSGSAAGKTEVSDAEEGRIPYHQSESLSVPAGGTMDRNDDYEREQYDRAAADIERILDKMAEKAACEQLENERLRELNEAAQNISYGNIHDGVSIRINRIASVDEELKEQYDAVAAPLINISRQLQKSLVRQLKESRRGGKQTGLIMGRRLDTHALCRNDGKVFYRNRLPNEIPELAVTLLLDESGSMRSCDRCTYARAAAVILYDFCRSLGIPVMVYGHSTGYSEDGDTVELYSYAEFESFDQDDKYRLMDIKSRSNNRDGAALRFAADRLSKRSETVKLLILVSDGQPADSGYSGSAAEEDLRGIKQEYQRKGVLFVAAAIGEDKPNIERIYGDSFMDISDLNQMPIKLTSVVKRHIRV